MLRPRNHAWTQSHHLMKALLEAMLLYKHQLLYDTYYILGLRVRECEFVWESISFSFKLSLSLSMWVPLLYFFRHSLSLFPSLSVSAWVFVNVFSLSHSLFISLSLSLSLWVSESLSLSLSLSACIFLFFKLAFSPWMCMVVCVNEYTNKVTTLGA